MIIEGLPDGASVELTDFYARCGVSSPCTFVVDSACDLLRRSGRDHAGLAAAAGAHRRQLRRLSRRATAARRRSRSPTAKGSRPGPPTRSAGLAIAALGRRRRRWRRRRGFAPAGSGCTRPPARACAATRNPGRDPAGSAGGDQREDQHQPHPDHRRPRRSRRDRPVAGRYQSRRPRRGQLRHHRRLERPVAGRSRQPGAAIRCGCRRPACRSGRRHW